SQDLGGGNALYGKPTDRASRRVRYENPAAVVGDFDTICKTQFRSRLLAGAHPVEGIHFAPACARPPQSDVIAGEDQPAAGQRRYGIGPNAELWWHFYT